MLNEKDSRDSLEYEVDISDLLENESEEDLVDNEENLVKNE